MITLRLIALPLLAAFAMLATQTGSGSATEQKGRLEEIVVVFKTHFDIGYTEMAVDVVHQYRTDMIDKALEVVRPESRPAARAAIRLDSPRLADDQDPRGLARADAASVRQRVLAGIQGRPFRGPCPALHASHRAARSRKTSCAGFGFSSRLARAGRPATAPRCEDDGRSLPLLDPADTAAARRGGFPPPRLQRRPAARRKCRCSSGGRGRTARACSPCTPPKLRHRLRTAAGLAVQDLAGADPHRRQSRSAARRTR